MHSILKTAKHYWRVHLIVALCTAVATGVLAGALIVGDSMRGSLRNITLERLGKIQHAVIADHFFNPEIIKRQNMERLSLPILMHVHQRLIFTVLRNPFLIFGIKPLYRI